MLNRMNLTLGAILSVTAACGNTTSSLEAGQALPRQAVTIPYRAETSPEVRSSTSIGKFKRINSAQAQGKEQKNNQKNNQKNDQKNDQLPTTPAAKAATTKAAKPATTTTAAKPAAPANPVAKAEPASAPAKAAPEATTAATTPPAVSGVQIEKDPLLNAKQIYNKIISKGVSPEALKRLNKFLYENTGRDFYQDTYACAGRPTESFRPCEESKRAKSSQKVSLGNPRYVVIVDFTKPSTDRRLFLIDRSNGEVYPYYAAHGIGSGNSKWATRFSNTKDSRQTSLGFYVSGGIYDGKYGKTLRMYGLEKSNDQAYNRDIVFHGAWYVGEDFINSLDPKTQQSRGRLGVSWGCPATSTYVAQKIMPYIKEGSLIFHYHEKLVDEAQSGKEVRLKPEDMPPADPTPVKKEEAPKQEAKKEEPKKDEAKKEEAKKEEPKKEEPKKAETQKEEPPKKQTKAS